MDKPGGGRPDGPKEGPKGRRGRRGRGNRHGGTGGWRPEEVADITDVTEAAHDFEDELPEPFEAPLFDEITDHNGPIARSSEEPEPKRRGKRGRGRGKNKPEVTDHEGGGWRPREEREGETTDHEGPRARRGRQEGGKGRRGRHNQDSDSPENTDLRRHRAREGRGEDGEGPRGRRGEDGEGPRGRRGEDGEGPRGRRGRHNQDFDGAETTDVRRRRAREGRGEDGEGGPRGRRGRHNQDFDGPETTDVRRRRAQRGDENTDHDGPRGRRGRHNQDFDGPETTDVRRRRGRGGPEVTDHGGPRGRQDGSAAFRRGPRDGPGPEGRRRGPDEGDNTTGIRERPGHRREEGTGMRERPAHHQNEQGTGMRQRPGGPGGGKRGKAGGKGPGGKGPGGKGAGGKGPGGKGPGGKGPGKGGKGGGRNKRQDGYQLPGSRKERMAQAGALAIPLVLTAMAARLSTFIDIYIVSDVSQTAKLAVVTGGLAFIIGTIPAIGIGTGVQTFTARRKGENEDASSIVATGITATLLAAVVSMVLVFAIAPQVMGLFDDKVSIMDESLAYLNTRLISMPLFALSQVIAGALIGYNRAWRAFGILFGGMLLDVSTSWYLVNDVPQMGVKGAALGSVVAEVGVLFVLLLQWPAFAKSQGFAAIGKASRESWASLKNVVGAIGVRRAMRPLQVLAIVWIFSKIGTLELQVGSILLLISMFSGAPAGAFGRATATLAQHDLGEGERQVARQRPKDTLWLALGIMGSLSAFMFFFPDLVLGVLFDTQAEIELGRWPMRIVALTIPMTAVTGVFATTILAVGGASTIAWMALLLRFLIAIPLAYIAAIIFDFGLIGVFAVDMAMASFRMFLSIQAINRPRWTRVGEPKPQAHPA